MSNSVVTGLNINKTGADPELKDDAEMPEWLWPLAKPERTLGDLRRAKEETLEFEDVSGGGSGAATIALVFVLPPVHHFFFPC